MRKPHIKQDIKILATVGPSSMKKTIVQKMDASGVDIFRVNLSHTKIEDLAGIIEAMRGWTHKPICVDSEGAQIRTGTMKNNGVTLRSNSIISLVPAGVIGDEHSVPLYPITPADVLELGDILYIDFNSVMVQVIEIQKRNVLARVLSGGKIGSNKGVNADRLISLPPFTAKDMKAFDLSKKMGLNHYALSFAANGEDVKRLRGLFPERVFIISKIESRAGLRNLEDICKASDAILIDRGDLSREIPLTRIALAQNEIIGVARSLGVPVYTATNLLESMIKNFKPTRGEINDITSTLLAGARGLVLAAETAIGKYPVESVRIISEIKKEVEDYVGKDKTGYFGLTRDHSLIPPHGGVLVQNFIDDKKSESLKSAPKVDIDEKIFCDVVQIAEGTYSPLRGFMNRREMMSVLDNYRLPNGIVWTLPIIFQLPKKDIHFSKDRTVFLRRSKDKNVYALMRVSDIEKIDVPDIARKWFGTDSSRHPGVAYFSKKGDHIVSGEVFLLRRPTDGLYSHTLTPRQTRQIFKERGWQRIVGFHTRNVIHRAHEYIQKKALEKAGADALFLSPVVGPKKPTDFSGEAILRAYGIMLDNDYYKPYPVVLGTFNTYSRYSGPREAVFTALCRKNFGCSHFVVGRDHTGVGNYYSPDASYKIFETVGDIGIVPLMFDAVYFCKKCNRITEKCSHGIEHRIGISGTKVRESLLAKKTIPEYLMRKDIAGELQRIYKHSPAKLFEGDNKYS